jgi:putative transposase
MKIAMKVRLFPTDEQIPKFWQSAGTARFIYNWTLGRQNENYEKGNKFLSDCDLRKEITQLKKSEIPWLKDISNNVAKQAVKDACGAFIKFFKKKAKRPRFKTRKKTRPSFYNDNEKFKVKEGMVLLEKIGWVKTKEQIPLNQKYSNPRITFDGKYWYVSVGLEREVKNIETTGESIGIDVGLKDLAICSNGMKFKNINKTKEVKKLKKKLKQKQRIVSRKYNMNKTIIEDGGEIRCQYNKTNNIIKLERKIRLIHRRLKNIRNNHVHQTTNTMVKLRPARIVMEKLNIQGMMKNKHLSKAIQEQCLYDLKTKMKYKCELNGIEFVEADTWFPSSKTCSCCGTVKKDLKLKDRTFVCPECGVSIDRDLNASINLSKYKLA